jgi:beclin 1
MLSDAEKLAQLPAPGPVKDAWTRAAHVQPAPNAGSPPMSPRAQGKQPQRGPMPNESFVLLQDSVVRHLPTSPTKPTKPSTPSKARSHTSSHPTEHTPSTEATQPDPAPLSHHLRAAQRLFTLLGSRTELDHPLCGECTHVLLTTLERTLEETKKERDGYIAFEKEVRKEKEREGRAGAGKGKEELEERIEGLKDEESLAVERLKAAEREREELEEEMRKLDMEGKVLEEEEAESVIPLRLRVQSPVVDLLEVQVLAGS